MTTYNCHSEDSTIITHHLCDKSNNTHHDYITTMMMSEASRPVLKIPLRPQQKTGKNEKSVLETRNKAYSFPMPRYFLRTVPIMLDCFLTKKSNKKKYRLNFMLKNLIFQFILLLVLIHNTVFVDCAVGGALVRKRDDETIKELCKNFTHGNPDKMEFASPQYGHEYPKDLTCFRTITSDHGYFVRIDFRDLFNVEPPSNEGNCDYDYLEIRDGDQGYSPLIGKFCGNQFPRIITSKGRSLWLRFSSDSTIQYKGFKIVYRFIPDPHSKTVDMGKCTFDVGGHQGFIGTANISETRISQSMAQDSTTPIDCVWTITVEENYQIFIKFDEPQLKFPNDCHLNYLQVFDGNFMDQLILNEPYLSAKYCGTVFDNINSKKNIVYVRFYAEKSAIQDSSFSATFTAMRDKDDEKEACKENEYDCEDATCINPELVCNVVRNCKFGWDEESCGDKEGGISLDFSSPTVFMILIVLVFILCGMCAGMLLSFKRTLKEDEEDEEEGEDNDGAEEGNSARSPSPTVISNSNHKIEGSTPRLPTSLPPQIHSKRPLPPHAHHEIYQSNDESNGGNNGGSGGCYVPDGGFSLNARF